MVQNAQSKEEDGACRKRRRLMQLSVAVIGAVCLVLCVPAAAFAYWISTGSGVGQEVVSSPQLLTISPGTLTSLLSPGGQADVAVTISNTNLTALHLGSLALATSQGSNGMAVGSAHTGCNTSALTYLTETNSGAAWTVPARKGPLNGTLLLDLAGAVTMGNGALNACQGASFTIYLSAGP